MAENDQSRIQFDFGSIVGAAFRRFRSAGVSGTRGAYLDRSWIGRWIAGASVELVESDTRKAAFLRTVSRETGSPAIIHTGRIEAVLPTLSTPDVISARALAPLPKLLEWTGEKITKGATALFLKGQDVDAELNVITNYSMFNLQKLPSRTDEKASIVKVTRA